MAGLVSMLPPPQHFAFAPILSQPLVFFSPLCCVSLSGPRGSGPSYGRPGFSPPVLLFQRPTRFFYWFWLYLFIPLFLPGISIFSVRFFSFFLSPAPPTISSFGHLSGQDGSRIGKPLCYISGPVFLRAFVFLTLPWSRPLFSFDAPRSSGPLLAPRFSPRCAPPPIILLFP